MDTTIATVRRRLLRTLTVPVLLGAVLSAGCDLAMSELNTEETAEWRKSVNGGIKVRIPRDAKTTISANMTNGGISAGDLQIDATARKSQFLSHRLPYGRISASPEDEHEMPAMRVGTGLPVQAS